MVDHHEIILNKGKVNAARSVGLSTSTDIIGAAMKYQTQGVSAKVMGSYTTTFSDQKIVSELKDLKQTFQSSIANIPQNTLDGKTLIETIKTITSVKNIHHGIKPTRFE